MDGNLGDPNEKERDNDSHLNSVAESISGSSSHRTGLVSQVSDSSYSQFYGSTSPFLFPDNFLLAFPADPQQF